MTTIAYDGRYLAADSAMRMGSYRCPKGVKKIRRHDDCIYAITGYQAWFDAWINWHLNGADPAAIPPSDLPAGQTGNFLVMSRYGLSCYSSGLPYPMPVDAPDAWGSGCEYAIGAMLHGASAQEAIAIAIAANPDTEYPIITYDRETLDRTEVLRV